MSDMQSYDMVVIGTGPGGEGAAMMACKLGYSVAVIERHGKVGGGCTHWGTIPSKALRHAVHRVTMFQSDPLFGQMIERGKLTFPNMLKSAYSVIDKQVDLRRGFYTRNDVDMYRGQARFIDEHTIEVLQSGSSSLRLHAKHVVIASGSRPFRPKGVNFSHPRVYDSDTILSMDYTPKSICIYGAGVIGCEYTSIFRRMKVKTVLVNTRDKLLSFLDDEIIDALAYHLRDQGVQIRHNESLAEVEANDDSVVLHLESGKKIKTDVLLYAQGRSGNAEGMNLEGIGVEYDKRGRIPVDDELRTNLPHIGAAGDVIGPPGLASASYDQGRYVASRLLGHDSNDRLVHEVPTGIYTGPEISSIGRTERELTEAKIPYEVGHAQFRSLARAQITGQMVGMLKLLFHRDTLQLLGIHCFGQNAAEIVHIGQAVMAQEGEANSLNYFVNTTFNYPTMAEAYRVAALNGLNRLF